MNKLIKQAFTLIELLVVIAIVGILSGLIVVAMGGVTTKATIAKAQIFSNSLKNSLMMNIIFELDFDDLAAAANGTVIRDSWGNNNGQLITDDGTVEKLKTGSDCISGKCISLDGSGDYISLVNNILPAPSGTYSGWILTSLNSAAVKYLWVYTLNGGAPEIRIIIYDNKMSFRGYDNGAYQWSFENNISLGAWHNIVMTWANNDIRGYIDGVLVGSDTSSTITSSTSNYHTIGYYALVGHTSFFNGSMDEIRLYGTSIPTSQIKEQYYAGLNKLLANGGITKEDYLSRINILASK